MSKRAWFYIGAVLLTGALLVIIGTASLAPNRSDWVPLANLLVFATITQIVKARAPGHQSYHPAILFFFVGVLVLPPGLYALLVILPHAIELAKERLTKSTRLASWYLQPFNVSVHIIAGAATRLVFQALMRGGHVTGSHLAGAGALAAVVYVFINHMLVGQAIVLARDVSWQDSGILDIENLAADYVMLCLGQVVAYLARANVWLILPALTPLALMYRALSIPQLRHEASTDAKTGLLNAKHLIQGLDDELARSKRHGRAFALVMTDLDLLRNINNTYGHLAGDEVIITVAQEIRRATRTYDLAARFGGEEFVIVLPETSLSEARAFAERLRSTIANTEIQVNTSETPLTATLSLGVAMFPDDGCTTEDLIHEADLAVYEAKRLGRNQVICAADMPESAKQETMPSGERTGGVDQLVYVPRPIAPMASNQASSQPSPVASSDRESAQARGEPTRHEEVHRSSTFWINGLISVVVVAALASVHLDWPAFLDTDWLAVVLFMMVSAAAELLQMDVYGESTLSVGVGVSFAAAVAAGMPAVVGVATTTVLVHYFRRKPAIYKTAYNWAVHVLAGLTTVLSYNLAHYEFTFAQFLPLLAVCIPAAIVYFVVESGLITLAVSLAQGGSPIELWRQHYRWLGIHYVMLCCVGLILALAYTAIGPLGIVAFTVPLLMMRYSQAQYIQKTEHDVKALVRINEELMSARDRANRATAAAGQMNNELFLTLAKIIDARDPMVAGHAMRVRNYAVALGRELELPKDRIEALEQAALLHDIGKIGISEKVLHKAGKLSPGEYEHIKQHAWLGGDFLQTSAGLRHLAPFVLSHHERWDGKGYPQGLKGEEIALEARILALCDSVEAMASDRPYRDARPWPDILQEVRDCAGTQFDPALSKMFVELAMRKGWDNQSVHSGLGDEDSCPRERDKVVAVAESQATFPQTVLSLQQ